MTFYSPRFKVLALFMFFSALTAAASAETIVTHETEKFFYKNGKMEKFQGQFENTYFLDLKQGRLVRTRVYDFVTRKITPDETVYQIQTGLHSDPSHAGRYGLPPFIRAVGQTGPDTVELIVIEEDFVHTAASTADSLVVARARRLK